MKVEAPWPGVVQEIMVAVGDLVEVDQEVVTVESMKMLTPVPSPLAGRVAEIHVEIGGYVDEGAPLLTLE